MNINRLFVAMLLVSASLTAVACGTTDANTTGSALDDPVEPVEPAEPGPGGEQPGGGVEPPAGGGQPGGQPNPVVKPGGGGSAGGSAPGSSGGGSQGAATYANPADYLGALATTQRVDMADLTKACGQNAECTSSLDAFKAYLQTVCATSVGCTNAVANLLYKTRTASQKSSGTYPATFPQAKDVLAVLNQQSAVPVEPVAGSDLQVTVATVVADLRENATDPVTWDDIEKRLTEVGGASGQATADVLKAAMTDAPATMAHAETIQNLLQDGTVVSGDAADAIEEVAATIEG